MRLLSRTPAITMRFQVRPDQHPRPRGRSGRVVLECLWPDAQRRRKHRQDLCAITAAMKYGTGLQFFSHAHPERFFDVGMAEQHAVTFAAGLASKGMLPVVCIYSTFLQRSYDQIIHDVNLLHEMSSSRWTVQVSSPKTGRHTREFMTRLFSARPECPSIRLQTTKNCGIGFPSC